jgi:N-acetylneuraminic acid mutarotase
MLCKFSLASTWCGFASASRRGDTPFKNRAVLIGMLTLLVGFCQLAGAQTGAQSGEWTWMGGSKTEDGSGGQPGVYGALGMPAAGNIPGSRSGAVSWVDHGGNLWLFGGLAYVSNSEYGFVNDLWEFDPVKNEWAWMGGSSTVPCDGCGPSGVYGTLGVPAAGNVPGGRSNSSSWADGNGNLWLFGGYGVDANGTLSYLGDLWEFKSATNEWVWMGGSNLAGQSGVYGTMGVPAVGNIPAGRSNALTWSDSNGNLWLYGGVPASFGGNNEIVIEAQLDDLWEFNPSTNLWTWVGGIDGFSVDGGLPGVYGTLGTAAVGNYPGARLGSQTWTDGSGHLWLFGGSGEGSAVGFGGILNDLWEFDPPSNEWAWMGGSDTVVCGLFVCGQPGTYGSQGTPSVGNIPSSRENGSSWVDSSGDVWLFGGNGADPNGNFGALNDLWEFSPPTNEWTWIGGSNGFGNNCTQPNPNGSVTCGQPGVYGTLGATSAGNNPGGRSGAASWIDNKGRLWLFGGIGFDANGKYESLNDLWEYQLSPALPAAAAPTFSPVAGTYSTTQTVSIDDATAGATIYYTTDGTTPTNSSTVYSGPVLVETTETLEAVATASGDSPSSVATATYTIPQNFALVINPSTITVKAGQSGTTTVEVVDEGGFSGNVSFACSGLPVGAACSFALETVPTPVGITYTTLTVTTPTSTANLDRNGVPIYPGPVLAIVVCIFGRKKRRRSQMLLLLAVSVVGPGILNGCGANGPPEPITSTVTVTGTSGSLQQTATLTLTVN